MALTGNEQIVAFGSQTGFITLQELYEWIQNGGGTPNIITNIAFGTSYLGDSKMQLTYQIDSTQGNYVPNTVEWELESGSTKFSVDQNGLVTCDALAVDDVVFGFIRLHIDNEYHYGINLKATGMASGESFITPA